MSKKLYVSFIVSMLSITLVQPMTRFARTPGRKLLNASALLPQLSARTIGTAAGGAFKATPVRYMTHQEAQNLFNLPSGSSEKEINKKYKELSKKYHPDLGGSTEKMKDINSARDILLQKGSHTDYATDNTTTDFSEKISEFLQLFGAIQDDNIERVKSLLSQGADVNAKVFGITFLEEAVKVGNIAIVELLLASGADVNAKDRYGYTALKEAVKVGNIAIVELLLASGADINIKDILGRTVLWEAIESKNIAMIKFLLANGVDVNAKDIRNNKVLSQAVKVGNIAIVELLLASGADINIKYKFGRTVLWDAIESKNIAMIKFLLAKGVDAKNLTDALLYIFHSDAAVSYEIAKLLLEAGADINETDGYEQTILIKAVRDDNREIIEFLLENGADINKKDAYGRTPLMNAVKDCNYEMVKFLLEAGADVNIASENGASPLSTAFGDIRMMKLLLEKNPELKSKLARARAGAIAGAGAYGAYKYLSSDNDQADQGYEPGQPGIDAYDKDLADEVHQLLN